MVVGLRFAIVVVWVFWVVAMGFGGVGLGLPAWVWWVWVVAMGFGGVGLGGPVWVWVCRRGYGGFGWLPWDSVA